MKTATKKKPVKKESFKNYVRRVIAGIKRHMFLHEWTYSIHWESEDKQTGPNIFVNAEIDTSVSYLTFNIKIYPQVEARFNAGKYEEVTDILCHELCHVYTEPMYQIAFDLCAPAANDMLNVIREQQTQRTANAIAALLPKELKTLCK